MIHLTAKQGRILVAAIYNGIQDRELLLASWAPCEAGVEGAKEIRSIRRDIAAYNAVRHAIFEQLPKKKTKGPKQ